METDVFVVVALVDVDVIAIYYNAPRVFVFELFQIYPLQYGYRILVFGVALDD